VSEVDISERKLKILSVIVQKYVESGFPVSSKSVCDTLNFPISSATVRNEMFELFRLGYLEQPYTSAGRIPSGKGYRLYINELMPKVLLSPEEKNVIGGALYSHSHDPENLIERASDVLAKITNLVSIFTSPSSYQAKVRNIQFVKTGEKNAMIVLMTTSGMIKNKLFRCLYDITSEMISVFGHMLNEKFRGVPLSSIISGTVGVITDVNSSIYEFFLPIFNALVDASQEALEVSVKMGGQMNLFSSSEMDVGDTMRLLSFLSNKSNILELISLTDYNLCIKVGEEIGYPEFRNLSVIIKRYNVGGKLGSIVLIGPMRMNYPALISKMDYLSSVVEASLSEILDV
jgi:heat-inducible transcriptional repressor